MRFRTNLLLHRRVLLYRHVLRECRVIVVHAARLHMGLRAELRRTVRMIIWRMLSRDPFLRCPPPTSVVMGRGHATGVRRCRIADSVRGKRAAAQVR